MVAAIVATITQADMDVLIWRGMKSGRTGLLSDHPCTQDFILQAEMDAKFSRP